MDLGKWRALFHAGNPSRQTTFGKELRERLQSELHRQILINTETEQLPHADNRVVLSRDQVDLMGLPRPEIHFQLGGYEHKGMKTARLLHEYIFEKMGATHISHSGPHTGCHIMGVYRMGANPKDSVVDKNLRTHDHKNLFLLGSGVFPTGGTANPTLTIAALALRTASYVSAKLKEE